MISIKTSPYTQNSSFLITSRRVISLAEMLANKFRFVHLAVLFIGRAGSWNIIPNDKLDPVPHKRWNGVLDATKFTNGCVELIHKDRLSYEVVGSEDCLYLNVFTPTNPHKINKLLPVMVWIYGGAFREGNSNTYGPEYILNGDVIVVTFNYRLGIFGFLSTDDMESPGNYGLKDQLVALKWVKDNINKFGGDPSRITVFGESAGAASIGYLLLSEKSSGLFQQAIMQSGSPLCPWALQTLPKKIAFDFGLILGITTNNSATLMTYLRQADLSKSHSAIIELNLLYIGDSLRQGNTFSPSVEPSYANAVVTKKSFEAFREGNVNKIPLIVGINSQESKFFSSIIRIAKPAFVLFDLSSNLLVRPAMNVKSSASKKIVADKIKHHYFHSGSFISGTDQEYLEFLSDDQFVRPVIKMVDLLLNFVKVYFYVFSYEGDSGKTWLNKRSNTQVRTKGVAHAEDVLYLWSGHQNLINNNDRLTSRRLVKLWTNFAKQCPSYLRHCKTCKIRSI
ncbi:juvenile hormone esterase-like isoform X2 [Cylas formicarius]|uniref:juvenile hormone esterase-like isoform X2 n=1 Tax=Cylas formicarius TaxID=197179 RepID=UPI0029588918|nr:juvenile hormone esterase-like isoform X2 [Cylas formicarius]